MTTPIISIQARHGQTPEKEKEVPCFEVVPVHLMSDVEAIALGRFACSTLLYGWPDPVTYDPKLIEIAIARLGGLLAQVALADEEALYVD